MATPKKKKASKKVKPKRKATKRLQSGRLKKNAAGLTAIQVQYLDALRELHEVKKAAGAVGVARSTVYKWEKIDAYRNALDEAVAEAEENRKHAVRAEIHKLGFEGWEEEIVEEERALRPVADDKGELHERMIVIRQKRRRTKKRSMSALLWEGNLLHGNPARVEVTGKDGGPMDMRVSVENFRRIAGLSSD